MSASDSPSNSAPIGECIDSEEHNDSNSERESSVNVTDSDINSEREHNINNVPDNTSIESECIDINTDNECGNDKANSQTGNNKIKNVPDSTSIDIECIDSNTSNSQMEPNNVNSVPEIDNTIIDRECIDINTNNECGNDKANSQTENNIINNVSDSTSIESECIDINTSNSRFIDINTNNECGNDNTNSQTGNNKINNVSDGTSIESESIDINTNNECGNEKANSQTENNIINNVSDSTSIESECIDINTSNSRCIDINTNNECGNDKANSQTGNTIMNNVSEGTSTESECIDINTNNSPIESNNINSVPETDNTIIDNTINECGNGIVNSQTENININNVPDNTIIERQCIDININDNVNCQTVYSIKKRKIDDTNVNEKQNTDINKKSKNIDINIELGDKMRDEEFNGITKKRKLGDTNHESENVPEAKRPRLEFLMNIPARSNMGGKVLVCGNGEMGQLGLGYDTSKLEARRLTLVDLPNAVEVAAGSIHNLVLTYDGDVYSFGCNDDKALGRPTDEIESEFIPKIINLPGKAIKISAGDSHSACLLEDGRVFAWGSFRNCNGNMGLTLEGIKSEPFHLLPSHIFVSIASGENHLVMLSNTGKVFTVGCGDVGQLGRLSISLAAGDVRNSLADFLTPLEVFISSGRPISEIWAFSCCTFLREHGSDNIYGFGLNNFYQLIVLQPSSESVCSIPVVTGVENVKQISGGLHHTIVLKHSGQVFSIGCKEYGRLGLGALEESVEELKLIRDLEEKNITFIGSGSTNSFALSENGDLFAWGTGQTYQLGTGSEDDVLRPTRIVSDRYKNLRIIRVSGGAMHTIFLGKESEDTCSTTTSNDIKL